MYLVQSLLFVLPLFSIVSVQCAKMCYLNDYVCMTKGGQKIFKSVPDKDIEPLHADVITGTTGNIKFKLSNLTLSGIKNCDVTFLTANKVESTYEHHLTCPKLIMTYIYDVHGKVNTFEIEGQSNGLLTTTDYVIITYGKYEINTTNKDKISNFHTKSFYKDTHPGSMKFESGKLLTTKGVDIGPQFTGLVNKNWRAYERHLRDPIMTNFMAALMPVMDKTLSTMSLSESFSDDS